MTKYVVTFEADTEGNWCSQCAGEYESREQAQAAIDADETAGPDGHGNTCHVWIDPVSNPDDLPPESERTRRADYLLDQADEAKLRGWDRE